MKDLLASHRKNPIAPEMFKKGKTETEDLGYLAFAVGNQNERLRIRAANAATQSPRYMHLLNVAYDGEFGTNVVLMFGFMTVVITGKNLQQVIVAIEMGSADYIQEFDSERWQKPGNSDAPVIESIEIHTPESGATQTDENQGLRKGKPH